MKMSLLFLFFVGVLSFFSQAQTQSNTSFSEERTTPCKFLSYADSEKILGGAVELTENSWSFTREKSTFRCTYQRVENDVKTREIVGLYFIIEESSTEEQAKKIYEGIRKANEKHRGVVKLTGFGDEAYSHNQKGNFDFIMGRKGKFTVVVKVNKAVEETSSDELKYFVKRLMAEI